VVKWLFSLVLVKNENNKTLFSFAENNCHFFQFFRSSWVLKIECKCKISNNLNIIGGTMKGIKQSTAKVSVVDIAERERIKKIMSKPVNPRTTSLYWLSLGRFKVAD
jgi:hypothetical protein